MLRIVESDSAAAAKRYFDDGFSRQDYYTKKHGGGPETEAVGQWGGLGAARLGLAGDVTRNAFYNLCENRLPDGSASLTARTKAARRVGYDFNFNCPKSVSILYAMTGDKAILECFKTAVAEAMAGVETDMEARIRAKGGKGERLTGNLICATFIHNTTRPIDGIPDPHLHAHAFAFNATFDPVETRWKAGDFARIKEQAPYHEAVFHARFAELLVEHGYDIKRSGHSWELAGVPAPTIDRFSRRTAEIEQTATKKGIVDPKEKAGLGALTRQSKQATAPWAEIQADWRQRLSPAELSQIRAAKGNPKEMRVAKAAPEAIAHALDVCFGRSAAVTEWSVLEEALWHGFGDVTLKSLQRELARQDLGRREADGRTYLTKPELVQEENRLVAFARDGRGTCPALVSGAAKKTPGPANRREEASWEELFGCRDRVMLVRGMNDIAAAVDAIEAAGRSVVRLFAGRPGARSSPAPKGKKEPGSLSEFLEGADVREQARKGIIWLDGADKLPISSASKLFDAVKDLDARLVLSAKDRRAGGDEQSDLLKIFEKQAGLRSAEVQRFRDERRENRSAADSLGKGEAVKGLSKLEHLHRIQEVKTENMSHAAAAEYMKAATAKKSALIVSATPMDEATTEIRKQLREKRMLGRSREFECLTRLGLSETERRNKDVYERGQVVQFYQSAKGFRAGQKYEVLGRDPFGNVLARKGFGVEALPLSKTDRFDVFRQSTIKLAKGETIRVTSNGRTQRPSKREQSIQYEKFMFSGTKTPYCYRVPKDSIHQVTGFTLKGNIKLANGWILPKDFGHLDYGYCVPPRAVGTRSVQQLIIAQGSRDPERHIQFAAARGVESVTLLTDDKAALRESAKKEAAASSSEKLDDGSREQRRRVELPPPAIERRREEMERER